MSAQPSDSPSFGSTLTPTPSQTSSVSVSAASATASPSTGAALAPATQASAGLSNTAKTALIACASVAGVASVAIAAGCIVWRRRTVDRSKPATLPVKLPLPAITEPWRGGSDAQRHAALADDGLEDGMWLSPTATRLPELVRSSMTSLSTEPMNSAADAKPTPAVGIRVQTPPMTSNADSTVEFDALLPQRSESASSDTKLDKAKLIQQADTRTLKPTPPSWIQQSLRASSLRAYTPVNPQRPRVGVDKMKAMTHRYEEAAEAES